MDERLREQLTNGLREFLRLRLARAGEEFDGGFSTSHVCAEAVMDLLDQCARVSSGREFDNVVAALLEVTTP